MFIGEYSHTIDAKGRLIVPVRFREPLGDEFVVTKGLDGCLWVYPMDEWENFTNKLNAMPTQKSDVRKLTRLFVSSAALCEVDKQGRILIPAHLREFAKLEKDAVLAGVSNRVEIWSRSRWDEISNVDIDDMDDIAERLADVGIDF